MPRNLIAPEDESLLKVVAARRAALGNALEGGCDKLNTAGLVERD